MLTDRDGVPARCGPEPYQAWEDIAGRALAVLALGHLRPTEEHLVVGATRKSAGLGSVEEALGGEN